MREGGEESFVVITSNVPPVVYCRAQSLDDDCTVFVQLRSNEQNPVQCKNGMLTCKCVSFSRDFNIF